MLAEKDPVILSFSKRLDQPDRVCRRQFHVFFYGGKFVKQVENSVGTGETARHSLQHDPEKKIFENCGNAKSAGSNRHVSLPTVFSRSTLLRASLNSGLHLFFHVQML